MEISLQGRTHSPLRPPVFICESCLWRRKWCIAQSSPGAAFQNIKHLGGMSAPVNKHRSELVNMPTLLTASTLCKDYTLKNPKRHILSTALAYWQKEVPSSPSALSWLALADACRAHEATLSTLTGENVAGMCIKYKRPHGDMNTAWDDCANLMRDKANLIMGKCILNSSGNGFPQERSRLYYTGLGRAHGRADARTRKLQNIQETAERLGSIDFQLQLRWFLFPDYDPDVLEEHARIGKMLADKNANADAPGKRRKCARSDTTHEEGLDSNPGDHEFIWKPLHRNAYRREFGIYHEDLTQNPAWHVFRDNVWFLRLRPRSQDYVMFEHLKMVRLNGTATGFLDVSASKCT